MADIDRLKQALIAADAAGDVEAARELAAAIRSQGATRPKQGFVKSSTQGFNTGLASFAGFPVDAMNFALTGVDKVAGTRLSSDEPVGGSKFLKKALRGFDKVPALGGMTYDRLEDLHPSDRKWAVGGEVVGGSVIPAAAPLAYARSTTAQAPRLLQPMVESARRAPGGFAATEAGLAIGAGTGGAIAEMQAPGNDTARLAGELIGGLVNPTQAVRAGVSGGQGIANTVSTTLSRGGRERAAARILQDTVRATGESPEAIIRALRTPDQFNLGLTSGQYSGSPALMAVERRLGALSPSFDAELQRRPAEAFDTLRGAAGDIASTGNPQDLTSAMRERLGQTQQTIANRRQQAEIDALRGRQAIGEVGQPDMAAASVDAREALVAASQAARGTESQLWGQVPRDVPLEPANVLAARQQIRDRLLPNENMPAPVEGFTGALARQADEGIDTGLLNAAGEPITRPGQAEATSGDLLRLRNRALEASRDARAAGDLNLARQMDQIASGALDDLGGLSDTARAYSLDLNQRFRRGFPDDALARDAQGGLRIEPEQMLTRAFGGGGTLGDVRLRQLGEAAEFGGQGAAMVTQQDRFLRGVVQSVIDPATGRVNAERLSAWQRQNASLLDRMPQLRADLATAESAQRAFSRVEGMTTKATRNANRTLIAQLAQVENPVSEIGRILSPNNGNRVEQFSSISRAAANAGPEALAGLRSATLESMLKSATNSKGQFNFEQLAQELLYKGPTGRDPNLLEMMRSNNILDAAAEERVRAIVTRAESLTKALNTPSAVNKLVPDPDPLSDFVLRVVGANVGAKAGGGTGATLVAAGAGSKLMRKYFDKLPAAKVQAVLQEAAENPTFMAMLLEKPVSAKQAQALSQQINAYLYGAGILAASDEIDERRPLERSISAF
jgi:hypothetical protein